MNNGWDPSYQDHADIKTYIYWSETGFFGVKCVFSAKISLFC